jgi:hypothetical protein
MRRPLGLRERVQYAGQRRWFMLSRFHGGSPLRRHGRTRFVSADRQCSEALGGSSLRPPDRPPTVRDHRSEDDDQWNKYEHRDASPSGPRASMANGGKAGEATEHGSDDPEREPSITPHPHPPVPRDAQPQTRPRDRDLDATVQSVTTTDSSLIPREPSMVTRTRPARLASAPCRSEPVATSRRSATTSGLG